MKVSKAIKKIVALGMGATMLGATILGASAQNLNNYPNMFFEEGQFNGYLVVGSAAQPIDNIGMTNIALGLQAAAVGETQVCSGATTTATTVSGGILIEKSSTPFFLNRDIQDVLPTIDDKDMPDVLAQGEYVESEGVNRNNEDYTQKINFVNASGVFKYAQDKDKAPEAGPYLFFPRNGNAYEYILEFATPVVYENSTSDGPADLESTTIELQGQTYTINEVRLDASRKISKLTLMVGDTITYLTQGDKITKTVDGREHTIEMLDVTSLQDACIFNVDGSRVVVKTDATQTVNGVSIGVIDAIAVNTELSDADICQISLGATELTLESGKTDGVVKDGVKVPGSRVDYDLSGANIAGEWEGLKITWAPKADTYLSPGDEMEDPVFGNFKFVFGNEVADYETISYTTGTDDGLISFVNTKGDTVEIPMTRAASNLAFGDGPLVDEVLYFDTVAGGGSASNVCNSADVVNCIGASWLLNINGEAHVVEISDIDTTNKKISFLDLTEDTPTDGRTYTNGGQVFISGIGNVVINIVDAGGAQSLELEPPTPIIGATPIKTRNGAKLISMADLGNDLAMNWLEASATAPKVINATFTHDNSSDNRIEILAPLLTEQTTGAIVAGQTASGFLYGPLDTSTTNKDDDIYVSGWGTVVTFDSKDQQTLEIKHPVRQTKASAFIAPSGAALSTGQTGGNCVTAQTVNKIPSTVNKLDTQVTNVEAQNVITVGGPCVNTVTARLMGNPENCAAGFETGKALLKLIEHDNDNVALIVAGMTGQDTLLASKVLQDFETYADDLEGAEMMLTTVSESNIGFERVDDS